MPATEQSDEELLRLYRRTGDNAWLGQLLQRYTLLLLGVAMKYLKDKEAAEDAVQQIFLKTLTHLPAEEIGNFKGWLYILIRNHCLQQLRNKMYLSSEDALQIIAAEPDNTEALNEREISLEELQKALRQIPEQQRICVDAFYLQHKSYQVIMAETGYTFGQVKSFIQNGKRNLKNILIRNKLHQP